MSTAQTSASPARSPASYIVLGVIVLVSILAVLALAWVMRTEDSANVVQGSGVAVAETRDLPPFSRVELAGVNRVTIGVGSEQLVTVRADDNLLAMITTEVSDGLLVIDETGGVDAVAPMSVELTVPSLGAILLSGSGTIVADGHDLTALDVRLPGTGTVRAAGTVTRLNVDVAGTGAAELRELVARDATVTLSGTGAVFVNVTGTLDAQVSGTGSVVYTGAPDRVVREITGAGAVVEE